MKTKYFLSILILILFNSFCFSQDYWESIYSSEDNIHCLAINSIRYLFAGTQNGIYRSTNNGVNWDNILDAYTIITIEINLQDDIYSSPGPIYFSTDYGDNWETLNYPETSISHIFVSSQNNILVGFWGGIYKSSDNVASWELVLSFSNCEVVNSIVENSEGILFAGTTNFIGEDEGGGVYRSTDQGDSWEHIGLEYEYISSLAINSNGEIFAGSRGQHYEYGGGVFCSTDNGETWIELRDDVLVTSIAIDSEEKIFIGCSDLDGYTGAIHFSGDNGESWDLIESEIMPPTTGIEFITISEDDYIYAISYENIRHIFRSVQSTVGIDNFSIQNIIDCKLTNYPNPFNPTTTIDFSIPKDSGINLSIYNLKGQKVKTLLNEYKEAGKHQVVWNGRDESNKRAASGLYLYKIISGKETVTRKMLLLK